MTTRLGSLDLFPPAERFAYFDAASVGLTHKGAAAAINRWQQQLAEEGTVAFDEAAETAILAGLRRSAAALLNARDEDLAIASGETPLMASLAWAVAPAAGTNIVATEITHPSTVYPWMRVAESAGAELRWARGERHYVAPQAIEAMIDRNTAVVCLSHVEYGTGQTHDLKRFAEIAHRHGALLVADVTQSAGQIPIDVAATGVDAVAASTYKWICGPFGAGFLYLAPHLQDSHPGIVGWRSHKDIWDFRADRLEYPASALRYEFGTMAYGTALGAAEAIDYLLAIGIDAIARHNRLVADELWAGLEDLGAEILSPSNAEERSATVAARFPGRDSAAFAAALKRAGVIASLRRDFIRFSPHLYNDFEDVAKALSAIRGGLGG
jgi:selenocysteine lyase/cysteine desulfurase